MIEDVAKTVLSDTSPIPMASLSILVHSLLFLFKWENVPIIPA